MIHPSKKYSLTRLLKIIFNNFSGRNGCLSSWSVAETLARGGLVKRHQEIKQFYNLLRVIHRLDYVDALEEKKALRLARQMGNKKVAVAKKIPGSLCFKNAIKDLERANKGKFSLLFLLMLGSGRRAVDIMRIESSLVDQIGKFKYEIIVPFDKMCAGQIKFRLDFNAIHPNWRPAPLEVIDQMFRAELNTDEKPFYICKSKNLSRMAKNFHPHGIRTLTTLHLTSLGLSDNRIMKIIGWSDIRSLILYRRLSREDIVGGDLEVLVRRVNL